MSAITDIKCALTRKAFDDFCTKYHIPEEVHPVLPNQNDTMHERPAGKIGLYTIFFDYANFRLPLSSFLVVVLRHFHINISQLSVIGAAKVSHFEILCRVYGVIPTVGLFRCFYVNSKKNGWMSFSKRSDNAPVYMDILAFIHTPDPTKVKIVEREQNEDGPLLLQTTVGRRVPLLPVVPNRGESELEPRRQRKGKTVVVGAGEASHPPKKLREDHGTPSGPYVAGKSRSAVQRLLAGAVLNVDFRGEAIPTLPFVTSSISATPEREGGDHTNFVVGPNLQTISAPQRFIISSDSSHHSGANVAKAEVDSFIRSSVLVMTVVTTVTSTVGHALVVKEKLIFLAATFLLVVSAPLSILTLTFRRFMSPSGAWPMGPALMTVMVDEFAPPKFFTYVHGMEHGQLFTEFNVRAACQMSLSVEVRMRAEYNVKERRREAEAAEAIRLCAEASNFETVEKSLQDEVIALKEHNTILEKERNALDVHELELSSSRLQEKVTVYENCMEQLEKFQDDWMKVVNDKFDKLYTDFVEMALHLEEKFYLHLLTTISGRRWLLTHGMELAITKCLNSPKYLSALGAAIGKAIKKGMQDGLSAGITHGREGLEELQPNVNQLMVHIHHSPDKVVIGATALSLALDVSSIRPFSAAVLTGTEGTSDVVPATADTTTAMSITLAFASTIAPIFVNDYEVVGTNNQAGTDEHATPFPNVNDAELNIP
ncbi:hypothetical protein Tco_0923711 [Tanacetum coccineum]|uniref:Transposase (putative) gypsy type domain-containing protein n=1 Tax=Tanacetum coccineum TaxID=301880 RepID=A0ABQ5D368_9ASTR